jgi:uncharacterized protein (DUF1800 family)
MLEHVLRRMGFGESGDDRELFARTPIAGVIAYHLNYERIPDDVDDRIGAPEYVSVTARGGAFLPDTNIADTRQRWLFRMIHSRRPLEEKMALFWHNHFATAYSKIAGTFGAEHAAKMMDAKPANVAGGQRGQIQVFREMGMGKFRDLLVQVARDPAMLVWLDNRLNVRGRPQENFARELMELFTTGIGHYTEDDVYAAARVFTGWGLRLAGDRTSAVSSYYEYVYAPANHETTAKTFTFPVAPDGSRTIPARPAADGEQDGLDLIAALARHPATAERLARRLYAFFVSETSAPDESLVGAMRDAYLNNDTSIKAMLVQLFLSPSFVAEEHQFSRYSWPVEYVVRAVKETGWQGFSVDSTLTPLANMGQTLYEPPDVNGWALAGEWFSTASMLSRMNFAATLMGNQKFNLRSAVTQAQAGSAPEKLLDYMLARYTYAPMSPDVYNALLEYLRQGGAWTGSDTQVANKAAGLARLVVGAGEYQFN